MMRGAGYLCTYLNGDANIVGKSGALGVYGFGLKKERLGVAFKFVDGTNDGNPLVIMSILRELGCLTPETEANLMKLNPAFIYNDNGTQVGHREICFNTEI